MRGKYRVYLGGKLVSEHPNIITNRGKIAIGRFLAGERFTWSDAIAMGAGETAALVTDTELEMELWREEIDMRQYDNGEIVLRSIVPASVSGKFYEMGVYCTLSSLRQVSSSPIAVYFDDLRESWQLTKASFTTSHHRIGKSSIVFSPETLYPASGDYKFSGNFSLYDENSYFYLSYKILSGSIDTITIRLSSSETTYREYSVSPSSAEGEYAVSKWTTADFDLTGNADWTDFNSFRVFVEGDGDIAIDGFSVRNEPTGVETVLVSRTVLPDPVEKDESQEMQIEYVIDFGVNT